MLKMMIADDNRQLVEVLCEYSKKEGYEVTVAFDGSEAIEKFSKEKFDIVLLDVMMPKKDGFEVCREIRSVSQVPVIMITARGEDFEKIMGLDNGADDYIVKPFSPGEVMARVRAIMRRMERQEENSTQNNKISWGNLTVCLDSFEVTVDKNTIPMTKKETELLWLMATNKNKVFTRENLLDSVWGYEYFGDTRTVDSHIKRIRAKLDGVSHPKWQIKTVWGAGYKFEVKENEK